MTTFDPYAQPPQATAETSKVSVAALICSLIFCCPLTTVLGVLLGLIGVATTMNNPMRKGTGLAISAILIGVLATVLQVVGGTKAWTVFYEPIFRGPQPVLIAAFAGDYDGARASLYGTAANVSDAELESLVARLRDEFGEFQSAWGQPTPGFGDTEVTASYRLTFSGGTLDVETDYIIADANQIVQKTARVTFPLRDGDVTLPAAATPPPAVDPGQGESEGEGEGETGIEPEPEPEPEPDDGGAGEDPDG